MLIRIIGAHKTTRFGYSLMKGGSMKGKMKVRLNGKELDLTLNKPSGQKETKEENSFIPEEALSDIIFVKGLATGESIHWMLME